MFSHHVCMYTSCLLGATEIRGGHWISWNWNRLPLKCWEPNMGPLGSNKHSKPLSHHSSPKSLKLFCLVSAHDSWGSEISSHS